VLRVVTPTLGKSHFLGDTIASVTRIPVPYEHIVVAPANQVLALRHMYPCAIVIADAGERGGMYGAIEVGRKHSGSFSWFTYINDDDRLGSEFSEHLEEIVRLNCDVGYGRVQLLSEAGCELGEITHCHSSSYLRGVAATHRSPFNQQGTIIASTVFDRIGGFDASYRFGADFDFFARCIATGLRLHATEWHAGEFRCHAQQLSHQSIQFDAELAEIRSKYFGDVSTHERALSTLHFLWDNRAIYWRRLRGRGKIAGRQAMRPTGKS